MENNKRIYIFWVTKAGTAGRKLIHETVKVWAAPQLSP